MVHTGVSGANSLRRMHLFAKHTVQHAKIKTRRERYSTPGIIGLVLPNVEAPERSELSAHHLGVLRLPFATLQCQERRLLIGRLVLLFNDARIMRIIKLVSSKVQIQSNVRRASTTPLGSSFGVREGDCISAPYLLPKARPGFLFGALLSLCTPLRLGSARIPHGEPSLRDTPL